MPKEGVSRKQKTGWALLSGCGGRAVCHSRGGGHGALGCFFRQAGLWDSQCGSLETRAQPGHPLLPGLPQMSRNLSSVSAMSSVLGCSEAVFSPFLPCMWDEDPLMVRVPRVHPCREFSCASIPSLPPQSAHPQQRHLLVTPATRGCVHD